MILRLVAVYAFVCLPLVCRGQSRALETHFPGYHFCGPGTDFEKRVSRGQLGVNKLDEACRVHDMVYSNSEDLELRIEADKRLEIQAWERATAKESGYMEKVAAWMVTNAMKVKRKWNNRQLRRNCRAKRYGPTIKNARRPNRKNRSRSRPRIPVPKQC